MKKWFRIYTWSYRPIPINPWYADLLLAIPRIIASLILAFELGCNKFGVPWTPADKDLSFLQVSDGFVNAIANGIWPFSAAPLFFAWMAGMSETLGALFIAIGLKTRLFAFLLLITMLTAVQRHWGDEVKEMLPAMAFAIISLYSLVLGSGRFGIDHWMCKWIDKK